MSINQALTSAPLFFVRSGYVNSNSTLYNPGERAGYWSRSSNDSNFARSLFFGSSEVYPSYSTGRYYGFSLRCLYAGQ